MREHKFKAVDKNNIVIGPFTLEQISEIGKSLAWENLTWLEFTGLHDRHGEEIYEGDVVLCVGNPGSIADPDCKHGFGEDCNCRMVTVYDLLVGIIIFRNIEYSLDYSKKFGWVSNIGNVDKQFKSFKKRASLGDMNNSLLGFSYYEVIGNKFKNPELLHKPNRG